MEKSEINMPIAKSAAAIATATGAQIVDTGTQAASALSGLFTLTWPNLAAMAAFLYSVALLTEFCWKKFWRPAMERFGWIKPKPRRVYTAREISDMLAARDSDQAPLS